LLKGQPDRSAELFLAHPEKGTALAHACTDMNVNGM
jgi:hypothetical protein